jgi:hypothetical protein
MWYMGCSRSYRLTGSLIGSSKLQLNSAQHVVAFDRGAKQSLANLRELICDGFSRHARLVELSCHCASDDAGELPRDLHIGDFAYSIYWTQVARDAFLLSCV